MPKVDLVKRDERDAAGLFLLEHGAEAGSNVIIIHQDVEELVARRHLRTCAQPCQPL